MKSTNIYGYLHLHITALLISVVMAAVVFADRPGPSTSLRAGWQKEQADWRLSAGSRIKSITYPQQKPPPTRAKLSKPTKPRRKQLSPDPLRRIEFLTAGTAESIYASVIDSPPVDGFVPYIAVSVTDAHNTDEFSLTPYDALTEYSITGSYLTAHPESGYAIGIYDTGASAHVMGNDAATKAGLFSTGNVTSNPVTISGVTGETEALVSQPIGIFIDGLGAVEPNGLLWDRSAMMGQSNVAITVGEGIEPVDLPTAIGSPMSAYFTAVFYNDTQITVSHNDSNYTAPDIHIYQQDAPEIPTYANTIPLELRPLGASVVEYLPDYTDLLNPNPSPISPSVLTGASSQSVFFVASVDLYNGAHSAIDKTRFLLDTGAQISVVGSRVGARLAFNPANPDFEVEIEGVTGETIIAPGFYIDSIDIPALGDWLSFTNIPVILLDIPSPEGGTVDGIIGMNLFADLNFVLRGGGLFLQDDPSISYETIIRFTGDIAPAGGDGIVNYLDLAALADAWLANPLSQNWNSRADIVGDAIINFRDFAAMAQNWGP
jgi:predicted aspartyl protease